MGKPIPDTSLLVVVAVVPRGGVAWCWVILFSFLCPSACMD